MRRKLTILFGFMLAGLTLLVMAFPAAASPAQQAYYQTPTAGADGRVMYTVKAGDTCISISLLNNISVDDLRKLNNIVGPDCPVVVDQKLLLGIVDKPLATSGPAPTATSLLPMPTLTNGSGEVCIVLFEDVDGNGLASESEAIMAGGAVSLTDRSGKTSLTGKTVSGVDPLCFKDIPEGEYNISVAAPEGYNATTNNNYALKLFAGDKTILDFGAQISAKAAPLPPSEGGRSPMLAILGVVLVLGGAGLGVYMLFMKRG